MSGPSSLDLVRHLASRLETGESVVVATVVNVEGSTSAKPGSKAILDSQGRAIFGWVGGGCAESTISELARDVLGERRPRLVRLDLDDEVLGVGMPCGGYMDVYIEPLMPQPKLLILGHGRIAEALAQMGKLLELHVTVNDALATAEAFPDADLRIIEDTDYAKARCDAETYVVITTQHKSDYEALTQVLTQAPPYVAVVASQKRSALLLERLFEDGFPPAVLNRVSSPAGLDLAAETPQEVALSILAEIVQRLRGGEATGRALAEVKGVRITDQGVDAPEAPVVSEE